MNFAASPFCRVDRTRTCISPAPDRASFKSQLEYYSLYVNELAGITGFEPVPRGVTSLHCTIQPYSQFVADRGFEPPTTRFHPGCSATRIISSSLPCTSEDVCTTDILGTRQYLLSLSIPAGSVGFEPTSS